MCDRENGVSLIGGNLLRYNEQSNMASFMLLIAQVIDVGQ